MKTCWCGNTELHEYSDEYLKCDVCGTLVSRRDISYDANAISDESDFYGEAYWSKKMLATANKNSLSELVDFYLQERCVYWLTSLFRYRLPGQGSIAEVGCGLGQFSYLLKQCDYQQQAFEISPHICKYIRDTLKVNVTCGEFEATSSRCDAVVAFDVLEHFTNPHHFLETVSRALADDGILMLQTPSYDDTLSYAEMMQQKGRFSKLLQPEEHVYLYSRKSVKKLLEQYGFQNVTFLKAFFGDDYDMFLVASRQPIQTHNQQEIEQHLERQPAGRLIKALIALWEEKQKQAEELASLHEQWNERIAQINWLTEQLKAVSADHEQRLQLINQLSEKLEASERDRQARLEQINTLTEMVRSKER